MSGPESILHAASRLACVALQRPGRMPLRLGAWSALRDDCAALEAAYARSTGLCAPSLYEGARALIRASLPLRLRVRHPAIHGVRLRESGWALDADDARATLEWVWMGARWGLWSAYPATGRAALLSAPCRGALALLLRTLPVADDGSAWRDRKAVDHG